MSETTIQPALITGIIAESIAAEIGFSPGDRLVKINGQCPRDLIDYQFLCSDEILDIEVLDDRGRSHRVEIEKDYDEDLGLEFDTALFDGLIQCNNKCPFCFIDQQPPGKRESLYLKDDDYRLSFLYGSYLTLTNLTAKEWERIAQMRLSPLYVSVHATEPVLNFCGKLVEEAANRADSIPQLGIIFVIFARRYFHSGNQIPFIRQPSKSRIELLLKLLL